ncbi:MULTISPECIES: carbamoyltransferase HypF [Emticicia]|uniref:carbamoyltransferase HypF n=1 Tax=Emticicia TaxID=312278 RepID=UPI0007D8C91F|nr:MULTISPECIES: carbamoyltransferase HypF [Emticicia]
MVFEIRIKGQVQGVGFRPFIYRLAIENKVNGWVNNTNEGVLVEVSLPVNQIESFCEKIKQEAPKLAKITNISFEEIERKPVFEKGFHIIKSERNTKTNVLLSPDFAICPTCRKEIHTQSDRRFLYAFTTCTYCGPRYSITQKLPYDRELTSMEAFCMCADCQKEYDNVENRRYFSQTNSCKKCGVQLSFFNKHRALLTNESDEVLKLSVEALKEGKILAIKGIGGYLLMCDANNEQTIAILRQRKHRPTKPFAVMYPSLKLLEEEISLKEQEKEALANETASIVLLNAPDSTLATTGLLGVMLPYTPLFELIAQTFAKPIIATSGNLSHSPIVYQDDNALAELLEIADCIIQNNRAIVVPQDDSVLRFSPIYNQKIVLRRSRGLAPTFIQASLALKNNVLAMGAMLKSTFAITHENNVYISQYLGDLTDFDTQENYRHTLKHLSEVISFEPSTILIDKHKMYPSSEIGRAMAQKQKLNLVEIQHHQAHFAAVLAENDLFGSKEPILGIIWDGTGWGDDGQIWGGEFFEYQYDLGLERVAHFDYFSNLMGDKMAREPRLSALAITHEVEDVQEFIRRKFSETEWNLYQKFLSQNSNIKTSSVGRILDGLASLLGILNKSTYEGEAAMYLEAKAREFFDKNSTEITCYNLVCNAENKVSLNPMIKQIFEDIQKNVSIEKIAAKIHFSLIKLIQGIANRLKIKRLAFSGGVWQNAVLVDLAFQHLDDFELFFHKQLSPNDECISFGQLAFYSFLKTP